MKVEPRETLAPVLERMKSNIRSYNKPLHKAVETMSVEALLRNTHPLDRPMFAQELFNLGWINEELKEDCIKNIRFQHHRIINYHNN